MEEQPDFPADMNKVTNPERTKNGPAPNAGAEAHEAIRALTRHVCEGFEAINNRIDAIEYNSVARHINGYATYSLTPLTPLRDPRNQDVANFPVNRAALDAMNSNEIDQLPRAYDLPVAGDIGPRKSQLKRFIGTILTMVDEEEVPDDLQSVGEEIIDTRD